MPVVGGRIVYVEVKKEMEEITTGLNINIQIEDAVVSKGFLNVKYRYTAQYKKDDKDVGTLNVVGFIEFKEDSPEKIIADWKKTKQFPDGFSRELLSSINYAVANNGTLAARAANLPAPLVLPKIEIGKEPGKSSAM